MDTDPLIYPWAIFELYPPGFVEGDTDTDTDADSDTDTDADTDAPPSGAYYRATVEYSTDRPDPGGTLVVEELDGSTVTGTQEYDGKYVVFTPASPLTPSTTYRATATPTCPAAGPVTWRFTTSEVGAPVAADLTGATYQLFPAQGRLVDPYGLWSLQAFASPTWLLQVHATSSTTLSASLASLGYDVQQDVCLPTVESSPGDFAQDPYFTLDATTSASRLPLSYGEIRDIRLSGAFAPDGAHVQGIRVDGTLDTRSFARVLDPTCVPASASYPECLEGGCDVLESLGVPCGACPDGGDYCVPIAITDIPGTATALAFEALPDHADVCAAHASECAAVCP